MPNARSQINFDRLETRPKRVTPAVIHAVCQRIIDHVRPEKIILLGSQANGNAKKDSDLDLLIIVGSENPLAALKTHDRYGQVLRLFRYKGFGLDAIVVTNKEVQKLIDENEGEWDLILEILDEGKILYDQKTQVE